MNKKTFSHSIAEKHYLSLNSVEEQHLGRKHSFQGVPNQVRKSRKFQGVGEYDKHPLELKY